MFSHDRHHVMPRDGTTERRHGLSSTSTGYRMTMGKNFKDRTESELDRRLASEHSRRYADSDDPATSVAELRDEQFRELDQVRGFPGVPVMTGPMQRGTLWGGVFGLVVGALIGAPFALIPFFDLSIGVRLAVVMIGGAVAGATAGAIYFGSRFPELSGESLDADNTPSAGSTLADPGTDSRGRPLHEDRDER